MFIQKALRVQIGRATLDPPPQCIRPSAARPGGLVPALTRLPLVSRRSRRQPAAFLSGASIATSESDRHFGLGIVAAVVCGGTLLLAAGGVLADPATAPNDTNLTLHGVTFYGLIDIGLQYNTHAAPVSDYYLSSTGAVVQKNGNKPLFALVSNNMAVSRVGLKGEEPL